MDLTAVARGVRRSDVVLTVIALALCLVQVFFVQPLGGPVTGVVYTLVAVVPLAWRHARPATAAAVASSAYWIPTEAYLFLGYVLAILLFFALGRREGDWRVGALVAVWGVLSGTVGTVLGDEALVPALFTTWLVILGPYAIGRVMTVQAGEHEAHLRAEREAIRSQAVADERARIVRELHDVVGHEVTLMAIQSEAAAQAINLAPERAVEPIGAVRETAHRANRQLRAILDLLGDGEPVAAPEIRGLTELTERAARLGIPNTLTVTGEPWPHAPQHWLAVNRIVQECLTNAAKHAPGRPVELQVEWSPDGVRVQASNPAPGPVGSAGLGLTGMAERARTLGGTVESDRVDDVFRVEAWLPAGEES